MEGEQRYIVLRHILVKKPDIVITAIQLLAFFITEQDNSFLNIQLICIQGTFEFTFKPFSIKEESAINAKILRLYISSLKINLQINQESPKFLLETQFDTGHKNDYYSYIAKELNMSIRELNNKMLSVQVYKYKEFKPFLDNIEALASSLKYDNKKLIKIPFKKCYSILSKSDKGFPKLCLNGLTNHGFIVTINEKKDFGLVLYSSIKSIHFISKNTLNINIDEYGIISIGLDFNNSFESDIFNKFILSLELLRSKKKALDKERLKVFRSICFKTKSYNHFNVLKNGFKTLYKKREVKNQQIINKLFLLKRSVREIVDLPIWHIIN
jgi:hypothetical protein